MFRFQRGKCSSTQICCIFILVMVANVELSHTIFASRAIAHTDLPIVAFSSVLRERLLEMVELREVNVDDILTNNVFFFLGAYGWVEFSAGGAKLLMRNCRASSICAVRTVSSVNIRCLMRIFRILVFAWRRTRVNRSPSLFTWMKTPSSDRLKVYYS